MKKPAVIDRRLLCSCKHPYDREDLPAGSGLPIAIGAINRLISAGLERYFSSLATLSAGSREQLTPRAAAATSAAKTFCLACLTAFGTALRFIGVAFRLEKLLVFGTEREGSTTI
jgi:hypothetical protein